LVVVIVVAALAACSDAAPGGGQAPAAAKEAPSAAGPGNAYPAPSVTADIVSGCVDGSPLVKALISLTVVDQKCHADVTPASVCVVPGGVILWKVDNGCGPLVGSDDAPALEITAPTFKAPLGGLRESAKGQTAKAHPKLESCGLKATRVDDRSRSGSLMLFCEVDKGADYGFYKYGLRGKIDPLDPDVEVRGSH
jgi:hypothetical protein